MMSAQRMLRIGAILLAMWTVGLALKVTFAAVHLLLLLAIGAAAWGFLRSRESHRATGPRRAPRTRLHPPDRGGAVVARFTAVTRRG